eukprot:sb/3475129/
MYLLIGGSVDNNMFLLLFIGHIPAPTYGDAFTKTIVIPKQASLNATPEWPWLNRFSILNANCGGGLIKIYYPGSSVEFEFRSTYMKLFVHCEDGGNKAWYGGPAGSQCHPLSGMLINHYLVTFFPSRCE